MKAPDPQVLFETAMRIAERLEAELESGTALLDDRALAHELAAESVPVSQALLHGLQAATVVDRAAAELREAIALVSLLGRRAARLGATPSCALLLLDQLRRALDDEGADTAPLGPHLTAVLMEGYVGGRDEVLEHRSDRRASEAIAVVDLAPRCTAVFITGIHAAEEIERVFDDVGRRLLNRDAQACVVHAAGLRGADRERSGKLFGLHITCTMLGVRCVYSEVGEEWVSAATDGGLDLADVRRVSSFHEAMVEALARCGMELGPPRSFGGVLRRMIGGPKSS